MECPADTIRQIGNPGKIVRLQPAPRRDVRLRRWVIGEHLHDLADSDLADPLGQHDDRQRALAPDGINAERRLLSGTRQAGGGLGDQAISSGPGSTGRGGFPRWRASD